jgi:hypothetical protein
MKVGRRLTRRPLARSMKRENIYEIYRFEKNRAHQEHFASPRA